MGALSCLSVETLKKGPSLSLAFLLGASPIWELLQFESGSVPRYLRICAISGLHYAFNSQDPEIALKCRDCMQANLKIAWFACAIYGLSTLPVHPTVSI